MSDTPRMDKAFSECGKTPRMNWQASQCYEEGCRLERENRTLRAAQKACEDCDAPRVDRIDELERELAQIKAILADPVAVHLNMMRGTIAWTPENLSHLLGDTSEHVRQPQELEP